jgi:hypothetical protein
MSHDILQVLVDPRAWFAFGIVFFGGIVLVGEISQRHVSKMKPPPSEPPDDSNAAS